MDNLTWFQQFIVGGAIVAVGYAAFSVLALTWRLSNRVLAQAELYEAQTKFYEARTEFLEEKTRLLSKEEED